MKLFDALIYFHAASESTAPAAWSLCHCHDIVARSYLCRPFSQRHILISALFLSHIWFAYEWYTDFLQSFLHHFSFLFLISNWLQLQVPVVLNYSYRGVLALGKWLKAQRGLLIHCIRLSAASRPELLTGRARTVLNIYLNRKDQRLFGTHLENLKMFLKSCNENICCLLEKDPGWRPLSATLF